MPWQVRVTHRSKTFDALPMPAYLHSAAGAATGSVFAQYCFSTLTVTVLEHLSLQVQPLLYNIDTTPHGFLQFAMQQDASL